jgi:hypothetical protein
MMHGLANLKLDFIFATTSRTELRSTLASHQAGNEGSSTDIGKGIHIPLLLKIQSILISEYKMGVRNRLENQKS